MSPAARGEELRVGGHFYTTVQRLRALRSARPGRTSHDASDASPTSCYFAAAVRLIGKTFSAEAAARLVPPAIRPDRASQFWARSDELRSMFSVFFCFFSVLRASPGCRAGNAKVGVFTLRSLENDCRARACGPDEPRGDPRGPGGEAQCPDGGSTAWTERASETPGGERG